MAAERGSSNSLSMSASSSASWPRGRGGDIIDLDRYMRGNVRPSRPLSEDSQYGRLVVDGGGARKASGDARLKRQSHDSGVSDGSYRPRRRASRRPGPAKPSPARPAPSAGSLRAFRATCERALLDQQRQIARVAELCERLTERAERSAPSERRPPQRAPPPDSSGLSSSSRSTADPRRKDEHRVRRSPRAASAGALAPADLLQVKECKTYKIIMTKLDDLNRIIAARPRRPPRPPRSPSSSSVSVCDKLVATDPLRAPAAQAPRGAKKSSSGARPTPRARVVAQAFAVDIAPANVRTESIVKDDSSTVDSRPSAGALHCFDLDDPVHLYSQAKRLQALAVSTRRARSVEPTSARPEPRSPSLCAVCRGYWRYLSRCVAPFFGAADACECS